MLTISKENSDSSSGFDVFPESLPSLTLPIYEIEPSSADRVHVVLGAVGSLGARSACQDVLIQRGEFGFVFDHAQVIPLKVVAGDGTPTAIERSRIFLSH